MSHERTRPLALSRDGPLGEAVGAVGDLLARVTFWVAVCLPVALVGMLAGGLATPGQATTFLGLTGVELFALVAGRAHPDLG